MRKQGITASARPGPVHRRRRRILISIAAIMAVTIIAQWPVTTRFGANYAWSNRQIPLYEKVINFVSRDLQLYRLARDLTAGASTDEEKLRRLFSWVADHVRPTPAGFPVVDDHVLYVIIRGYGADDQRTEVFVTLAGYAGFGGHVARLEPPAARGHFLFVAFVACGDKLCVFDVTHGVIGRDAEGRLADVRQLMADPTLLAASAKDRLVAGIPYQQYFLGLDRPKTFSRTAAQQFLPRIKQELERCVHLLSSRTGFPQVPLASQKVRQ